MPTKEKTKKTPQRILLDEYHLQFHIRPKIALTRNEKIQLRILFNSYMNIVSKQLQHDLNGKVQVTLSQ
jgi:hypothetical protein